MVASGEVKLITPRVVSNRPETLEKLVQQDKETIEKLEINYEHPTTLEGREGTIKMSKLKQLAKEVVENWNLPTNFILFLSNSLNQSTTGRVIPWQDFRKMLFTIYD